MTPGEVMATGASARAEPGASGGDARPHVTMIVRNPVSHDARVLREAATLVAAGYRVTIFGRLLAGFPEEESRDGIAIVRVRPRGGLLAVSEKIQNAPLAADRLWKRFVRRRRLALARATRRRIDPDRVMERTPFGSRALHAARRVLRTSLRRPHYAASALAFQRIAADAVAAAQPAVIHCHDFHTLWAGRWASKRCGAPYVYDAHEIYAHQNLAGETRRHRWFVHLFERQGLRKAAAVVTVNDSIAAWLADRYRIALPAVVRNIPALADGTAAVEVPEPFTRSGTKLLYLGGITRGRGIEPSIRALQHVPDATLILMGPVVRQEYLDAYLAVAAEIGVADRVRVVPPVPHAAVTQVAAHADAGLVLIENVCLSYYLSLPNKLFECMHAGVPVVGSNFPEIARVVEGEQVGRTCDPADPAAIAAAVREVLDGAAGMRERARVAATKYAWENDATVLTDLYRRLAPVPARG